MTGSDHNSAFTSIAIGGDGNPIISHYDGTNGDLELVVLHFSESGVASE